MNVAGGAGRRGANGTETEGSQTGVDAAAILYDCLSDSVQLYSVSIGASTGIRLSGWLRTNKRTFIYSRISAAEPAPESIPDTAAALGNPKYRRTSVGDSTSNIVVIILLT